MSPVYSEEYDISDSSEGEEDGIRPWNARRSQTTTTQYEVLEISSDSELETDSDNVVDDVEDDQIVTTEGTKAGEDLVPGPEGLQQSSRTKFKRRFAFRETLARMETPADIKLRYPESLHPGAAYDESICRETKVLQEFSAVSESFDIEDDTFEELEITAFSVYHSLQQDDKGYHAPGQFEDLFIVSSQKDAKTFLLDGVITHKGESRKIVGAVIRDVSIGNLMNHELHTTAQRIWIQTESSHEYGQCWYRLVQPSEGYKQTWKDFIWLADLNKHVIDTLYDAALQSRLVRFDFFEADFSHKLNEWHGGDRAFQDWSARHKGSDYRQHLALIADFFRDQAYNVAVKYDCSEILHHSFWDEIGAGKFKYGQEKFSEAEQTVVTPFIGATFSKSFPGWGRRGHDLLNIVQMAPEVAANRERRRIQLGFPDKLATDSPQGNVARLLEEAAAVHPPEVFSAAYLLGKIVVVRQRTVASENGRPSPEPQFQFAWVRESVRSGRALMVVWLALPSDTICGSDYDRTFYPVHNELFFTDQCNRKPILVTDVIAACNGHVLGYRPPNVDVVVQMSYSFEDETFETPCEAKLLCKRYSCQHLNSKSPSKVGKVERALETSLVLRNMSLFSGCGLLDHGLVEAECFDTVYAIDHNEAAIRSHALNNKYKQCRYVIGSVNVSLAKFLKGHVALPEIDSIDAGSPCTGYSLINAYKGELRSQRNSSLVMSAASWIDLFLPEVVILENVRGMYAAPKDTGLANAGAQTICCLVALGYQVRKVQLFACDHGDPTIRERHFLVATAPSIKLPASPPITHGNDDDLLPFKTVRDALKGLEPIHNDLGININDPSHVPLRRLLSQTVWPVNLRNVVQKIPHTGQSGLIQAYQGGCLSHDQEEWLMAQSNERLKNSSRTLRRIDPDRSFTTMVTKISPLDSRMGTIIHPFEDRVISLREMRRAQGVPDDFLLVGNREEQIKLVGNGVAWQVAAALGTSIREALEASSWKPTTADLSKIAKSSERGLSSASNGISSQAQEIIDLTDELEETSISLGDDGKQLEEELSQVLEKAQSFEITDLLDGDTIVARASNDDFSVTARDTASDVEVRKREVTNWDSAPDDGIEGETVNSQALTSSQSTEQSEAELYEISDHESLATEPDGRFRYEYHSRGRLIRRSSSASKPKKKSPVIDLTVRRKRAASETPPPLYMVAGLEVKNDEESDTDVVFVKSKPVLKKSRFV